MKKLHCIILLWALLLNLCCASVYAEGNKLLAEKIINDQRLDQVEQMAKSVISQGLNAGSGYSQIWARDMNTFVETALEQVVPDKQLVGKWTKWRKQLHKNVRLRGMPSIGLTLYPVYPDGFFHGGMGKAMFRAARDTSKGRLAHLPRQ